MPQDSPPSSPHGELDRILASTLAYFEKTCSVLNDDHASFTPSEGALTTAEQIQHVAHTVHWFVEGAFTRPGGFNMEPEAFAREAFHATSVTSAMGAMRSAIADLRKLIASKTAEELTAPMPQGPVMGGLPRMAIVSGIQEHTAHHRGSLAVYARMQGLTPPMPYM